MTDTKLKVVTNRLYRSIPLIPVFASLYLVMLFLSPIFWEAGCIYYYVACAVGLSVMSAYSVTLFFDGYYQ
jgi:hypothetical protein